MIEKLEIVQQRFVEVSDLIIQPDVIADQKRYVQLNKEYKDLSKINVKADTYKSILANIAEAELMMTKVAKDRLPEKFFDLLSDHFEKVDQKYNSNINEH